MLRSLFNHHKILTNVGPWPTVELRSRSNPCLQIKKISKYKNNENTLQHGVAIFV